ncbi:GntR family transcriptional regulator [Candidimonas humi]|uniref:GntR family transcriptional regulator n=1 Tax=Candidimonas humi TaxID=683355 RepID=A0ABV8NYP5_9BURK|nr:GntR family transcriptional regulator [Candidimonas humi]MBV6305489.1 GntR family transcriptional regulator [Candidimonas humi]
MSRTSLAEQLANNVELWIRQEQIPEGTPLPERGLATRFRVSRSPVREALLILAERGAIVARSKGGYAVSSAGGDSSEFALPPANEDEPIYLKIAADRLSGELPERMTENELMRRYEMTRTQLGEVLRRISQEGWIERLPGNGWQFLPVLTSGAAYNQGYRMRILVEPAGILEPTYGVDRDGLLKCRAEQQALVDGAAKWASPAQLFDANTRLHECIAAASGNVFILESLRRLNRLRRLMEYGKAVNRAAAAQRCKEHLTLIDLLLADQREAAADFMRLHLRDAAREKAVNASAEASSTEAVALD